MKSLHVIGDGQGFTLIELLTAMVLMSLVLLPAFGIIRVTQFRSDRRLRETLEAHLLLRSRLVQLPPNSTVIDTISPSGFRFRLVDRLVPVKQDTKRCLIIMLRRGARWDTLARAMAIDIGRTREHLH